MADIVKEYNDDANDFKMHVGSGFFYIDSFGKIYKHLDMEKLNLGDEAYYNEWGTKAPILILMGKQTNLSTKEALLKANNIAMRSFNTNDITYLNFLEELINKNLIEFKVFTNRKFHAKIYFFYNRENLIDIYVGSANLTPSGLSNNIELTSPINGDKNIKKAHREWFSNLWDNASKDFNLLEVIENYKNYDFIYYEPKKFFENLINIMDKKYLFHNSEISDNTLLVKFQSYDFYQVMRILNKYNGCILASSVGLGKSYVALEVIRYFETKRKEALLIGPSHLVKEGVWDEYLSNYDLEVEKIGFGDLQQKNFNTNNLKDNYDLIVVDEAHNLRNMSNRRENMEMLINKYSNAKFLFLTATPINTKISDLTNLIDLFYNVNKFNWLNKELKTKYELFRTQVKKFEKDPLQSEGYSEIQKTQKYIEQELIVKTTRNMVKDYFKEDLEKLSGIKDLPEPKVSPVIYNYPQEYKNNIFNILNDFLVNLNYEHTKFRKDENGKAEYFEDLNLIYMYKWVLYKRAESSIFAFYKSLKYLQENITNYTNYLTNKSINKNLKANKIEKLETAKVVFNVKDAKFKEKILFNLNQDKNSIIDLINKIEHFKEDIHFSKDTKLKELKNILSENPRKKCLIFTEYYDTLIYLYKNLNNKNDFTYVAGRTLRGDSMKPSQKSNNINKFKNGVVQHLISTDVLSEGFNLPEADIVINYDLPYNPVKLIQRIGRATRINVPKEIEIRNFRPDKSIDQELELIEKLNLRISNIINLIGIDYSIWSNTEKMIKEKEKTAHVSKCKTLEELKRKLYEENPENLYNPTTLEDSKLDILIKNSIEEYNITENDIPYKKPNKPIYTSLISNDKSFYGIFKYNNVFYEYKLPETNFIKMPLNVKKNQDLNILSDFYNQIKIQINNLTFLTENQTMQNNNDKKRLNITKNLKKKVPPLTNILNEIIYKKTYLNHEIYQIILDITDEVSKDNFIYFDEKEKIDSFENSLKEINNKIDVDKYNFLESNIDYKKYVKAFIQYQKEEINYEL